MNELDPWMMRAWQNERPAIDADALVARLRRHRLRLRLLRATEIALTLAAVLWLGRALAGHGAGPATWLLLPFFVVYLPAAWALVLRAPTPRIDDVIRDTRTYARLRMSQLRAGLRDLWLARIAGIALLAYACIAFCAVFVSSAQGWRAPATHLLAYAAAWAAATFWLSSRWRRAWLREYRAARRLKGDAA